MIDALVVVDYEEPESMGLDDEASDVAVRVHSFVGARHLPVADSVLARNSAFPGCRWVCRNRLLDHA